MGQVNIGGLIEIYGDEDGSKAYFKASIHGSAWATSDVRKQALVTAARILDRQLWVSSPTDIVTPQPLAWPRLAAIDRDRNLVPDDVIPQDVIDAGYELALDLLDPTSTAQTDKEGSDFKRERSLRQVSSLKVETDVERFDSTQTNRTRFPLIVTELLTPFLGGAFGFGAEVNGADACSTIEGAEFGLSDRGFA